MFYNILMHNIEFDGVNNEVIVDAAMHIANQAEAPAVAGRELGTSAECDHDCVEGYRQAYGQQWYDPTSPTPLNLPNASTPNFNDLLINADAGRFKKILARYLFGHDSKRTERLHRNLGAPITRKIVMSTFGRIMPRTDWNNYRIDPRRSVIEGAARFAVGGSVFNEGWHTAAALQQGYEAFSDILSGQSYIVSAGATVANLALVSLQRYNRARMVIRINQEFERGHGFRDSYTNWLGLDARAVSNYVISLDFDSPPSGSSAQTDVLRTE